MTLSDTQESTPASRVLLVEEDADERRAMSSFLVRHGYEVVEAADGVQALACMQASAVDMIVSDLKLADYDGLGLLEHARKVLPETPFILVSGSGTMDDVIRGMRLGAWDVLSKPIRPLELLNLSLSRAREKAELQMMLQRQHDYFEKLVEQRTLDLLTQNRNYEKEIQRRQKMEEQARLAEDEWRRTVDALPEMVAIIDKDQRIVRVNKTLLQFLEKREDEVLGSKCIMCSSKHTCLHRQTLSKDQPHTMEFFFEQKQKTLELTLVPFTSQSGEWQGSVHIFRDVTKNKMQEREKEYRQSRALHNQKMESVGQLASGIAHEINTPTQFVSSNIAFVEEAFADIRHLLQSILKQSSQADIDQESIEALLEKADWEYLQEEIPAALKQSMEGLARVSSIVRAMKEFSHPGARETEQVDINRIIEVTVTVARNEWKYVADVDLQLSADMPKVNCLADEMGQVILNLLVNAAHAIEEKIGKTPEQEKGVITIATAAQPPWAVIRITDTGSGMPQHIVGKIFDPFFTTKSVGKGTGQGLAIAHDVVANKHDGNLRVHTVPGEGTTFIIELPLSQNRQTTSREDYA